MIHVIATIELHEGAVDAFLEHFRELVPHVRAEEGCLEYVPTVDVETNIAAQGKHRADSVTVIEKWEDLESLEAHLIAPHMLSYREIVKPMIRNVELRILSPA